MRNWQKSVWVLAVSLALAWTATQTWAGEKVTPSTVPTRLAPGQAPAPTFNDPGRRVFNAPWRTNTLLACDTGGGYSPPDGGITVNGNNVFATMNYFPGNGAHGDAAAWQVSRSTDRGLTWEAPYWWARNCGGDPAPFAGGRDTTYLVEFNGAWNGFQWCRTTNGGTSWSAPALLVNEAGCDKELIAIDTVNTNYIYNEWVNFGASWGDVHFNRSTDKGATWSTPVVINDVPNTGYRTGTAPWVGRGPYSGHVYCVWQDDRLGGDGRICMKKSTDHGATWASGSEITIGNVHLVPAHSTISNWRRPMHAYPANHPRPFPAIGTDSQGRIFISYCSAPTAGSTRNYDPVVQVSTDEGATWSVQRSANMAVVGDTADQYLPWLWVDPTDVVHVFWCDMRNYNNLNGDVYYSYSTDHGVTFSPTEMINDVTPCLYGSVAANYQGDYNMICADMGRVYVEWCDNRLRGGVNYQDVCASSRDFAAYAQFVLSAATVDTMNPTAVKTDSITVSSFLSFNSPVTMTLDSIRPATGTITVAFTPNPVTPPPNGSIKTGMRITTTATPANNYVLYYHGTGDTITRKASLNLWVTAPTFVLQSTPRVQTIFSADSASYADTLVSISGFSSPCTLSATVNPPAPSITVSFIPNNIVVPTGGRRMKVQTTVATPAVGYAITITARSGSEVKTLVDSLYVKYPVQGPDTYGYYAYDNTDVGFQNSPVYNWIELNPARGGNGTTVGAGGDDITYSFPLTGVGVRHYGTNYTTTSVCSNGWLSMGTTASAPYINYALPSASFVANGVAAFWDDLSTATPATWWYRRDAAQRFVAEWDSVPHLGGSIYNTFEIIVYDTILTPHTAPTHDSEIILQWKAPRDLTQMTVGQQNTAMTVGLNCFFNGVYDPQMAPIVAGRATKFTTDPPRPVSGVEMNPLVKPAVPMRFALGPAVPNPSRGGTLISYDLPVETQVSLKVYNLSGQLVRTLVAGKEKAGYRQVSWDGRSEVGSHVASGVYFYRMETGSFAATKKLVVVR
jgi:hypothetical protein